MKNINFLKKNLEIYKSLLDKIDLGLIRIFSNELKKIKKDKKKVLVFGNGAGAAISSHFCFLIKKILIVQDQHNQHLTISQLKIYLYQ